MDNNHRTAICTIHEPIDSVHPSNKPFHIYASRNPPYIYTSITLHICHIEVPAQSFTQFLCTYPITMWHLVNREQDAPHTRCEPIAKQIEVNQLNGIQTLVDHHYWVSGFMRHLSRYVRYNMFEKSHDSHENQIDIEVSVLRKININISVSLCLKEQYARTMSTIIS